MTDLFLGYPDEEITNWIKDIWPLTFPIYFEFLEDGYIKLSGSTSGKYSIELLYSFDNKTWLDWDYGTRIDVIAGRKFYIKAKSENLSFCNHEDSYMRFDTDSTKVNVAGNIMSLLYNDFVDKKELKTKMCFYNLFGSCYGLTDASNLILPATTLIDYCYYRLFATDIDFTSLLKAPKELPATTLATGCYRSMFYQC